MSESFKKYSLFIGTVLVATIALIHNFPVKEARPNILIIALENFYLDQSYEKDEFYKFAARYAKENNLSLKIGKEKGPSLNWPSTVGAWPESIWKQNKITTLGFGTNLYRQIEGTSMEFGEFYTEVPSDISVFNYSVQMIRKKIGERTTKPFFLMVDCKLLNPPFYDVALIDSGVSLSEEDKALLESYILTPERFVNKTFVYSLVFDEINFKRPTSFQTSMITAKDEIYNDQFWTRSYANFTNDPLMETDMKIVSGLYESKKYLAIVMIEKILEKIKSEGKLANTQILIVNNNSNIKNEKTVLYEKLFLNDLKKNSFSLSFTPVKVTPFSNIELSEELSKELLSKVEDY